MRLLGRLRRWRVGVSALDRVLASSRLDWDVSGGYCALSWMHHFIPHPVRGSEYLESEPLSELVARFVVQVFATDETGTRLLHDECVICKPKGSAKSQIGAYFCLLVMFGPSVPVGIAKGGERLEAGDWVYEFSPGEVLMEVREAPEIAVLATTKEQARKTLYQWVYRYCGEHGSERLKSAYHINPYEHVAKQRLTHPVAGELNVVATEDSADAADGGLQNLVVLDESHRLRGTNRETVTSYKDNLVKRPNGLLLHTSTSYGIGENSELEAFFQVADEIEAGESPIDSKLLVHTCATPGEHDLTTIEGVKSALWETYDGCPWMQAQADTIAQKWFDPRADLGMLNRLYLGLHSTPSKRWLVNEDLMGAVSAGEVMPKKGELLALGVDASRGRSKGSGLADSTVLVGCVLSEDATVSPFRVFPIKIWSADGLGWTMPLHELDYAVREAMRVYEVVGFCADPPYIEALIASWHKDFGAGLYTGSAQNRVSFWTNQEKKMFAATTAYEDAMMKGEVVLSNDYEFVAHHRNAERRPNRVGYGLCKKNPHSPDKIDGAVGAIVAFEAARQAVKNGAYLGTRKRRHFSAVTPTMT